MSAAFAEVIAVDYTVINIALTASTVVSAVGVLTPLVLLLVMLRCPPPTLTLHLPHLVLHTHPFPQQPILTLL